MSITRSRGVALFRRRTSPDEGTELLLLYVVGETPVAGIHQRAFDRAIEEIEFLSRIHSQVRGKPDVAQPVAANPKPDPSESDEPIPSSERDRPTIYVVGSTFSSSVDSPAHSCAYLQELADQAGDHAAELTTGSWLMFTPSEFTSIDKQFATDLKELRTLDEQGGSALPTMTATIGLLNRAGSQLWTGLLHEWTTRDVLENYPCSVDTEFKKSGDETGFEGWKNRAEELTAIQIRADITGYAAQLRHLLMTAMFSTILFLMAVLSYPMQPRSLLTSLAMIMVATISVMATWITVQFDRDEFLRRIQGQNSSGRQFDMPFWFRTLTWLAPAIMVLVSAIFPNAWDWVYTLLEPLLSATN